MEAFVTASIFIASLIDLPRFRHSFTVILYRIYSRIKMVCLLAVTIKQF